MNTKARKELLESIEYSKADKLHDFNPADYELNIRCLKKLKFNRDDFKLILTNLWYIILFNIILGATSYLLVVLSANNTLPIP